MTLLCLFPSWQPWRCAVSCMVRSLCGGRAAPHHIAHWSVQAVQQLSTSPWCPPASGLSVRRPTLSQANVPGWSMLTWGNGGSALVSASVARSKDGHIVQPLPLGPCVSPSPSEFPDIRKACLVCVGGGGTWGLFPEDAQDLCCCVLRRSLLASAVFCAWFPGSDYVPGSLSPPGDNRCFLFSIAPRMATHLHTGYNNHFMYLNYGQQTMPNGLVSRRRGGCLPNQGSLCGMC